MDTAPGHFQHGGSAPPLCQIPRYIAWMTGLHWHGVDSCCPGMASLHRY